MNIELGFIQRKSIECRLRCMKSILTLSFIVFCVASCTIEKRLHSRGWNVQWRKPYKVNSESNDVSKKEELEFNQDEKSISEKRFVLIDTEREAEQIVQRAEVLEDNFAESPSIFYREHEDTTENRVKTVSAEVEKIQDKDSVKRSPSKKRKTGFIFLILGLVLVFTLLFGIPFVLLSTAVTLIDIIGILLLAFLLLILGFICLMAGGIMISRSKKNNSVDSAE